MKSKKIEILSLWTDGTSVFTKKSLGNLPVKDLVLTSSMLLLDKNKNGNSNNFFVLNPSKFPGISHFNSLRCPPNRLFCDFSQSEIWFRFGKGFLSWMRPFKGPPNKESRTTQLTHHTHLVRGSGLLILVLWVYGAINFIFRVNKNFYVLIFI